MKTHRLAASIAGALMALAATAATAAGAEDAKPQDHGERDADLRCVVLARSMSASGEESMKAASALASYYFIGRLEGREPDLDLESAIAETTTQMQSMDVRPEATRCGDQLVNRASELRAIDLGLQRRARQSKS